MSETPKKRVVILLNRLVIGGVAQDTVSLAHYLSGDFEVLLLTGEKNDDEIEAVDLLKEYNGFQVKKIPALKRSINIFNDIKSYYSIKKIYRLFNPHIVHTHGAKPGLLGRLAAKFCKVPVIIHTYHGHIFHSYFNKSVSAIIIKTERWLASFSTKIIAISQSQKNEIATVYKICPSEKIEIIPLGIEVEKFKSLTEKRTAFREEYFLEPDEIAIGIIGRIVPVKNHQFFLEAIKKLVNDISLVRVFIIGDGFMREYLEDYLRDEMISSTYFPVNAIKTPVTFTSWQTDIRKVVAGLDIIALSSLNEGTPLSLMEAQAAAKPVIATGVGGVSEIILNQGTGYIIEPNNLRQYTEKLRTLIENETIRQKMGAEGQKFIQSHFSKQAQVSAHKALYSTL
jgi:glycosyltransferase involved in cell wall biosynthesis